MQCDPDLRTLIQHRLRGFSVQAVFQHTQGVLNAVSGYAGFAR
jgi:hypothetical protein